MYNHKEIEQEVKNVWEQNDLYAIEDGEEKKRHSYILVELPYPSGALHCGHWYAFAMPDMYARYRRMQGDSVMFPIGFDSFGLPAENAAIKHGKDPAVWTQENISEMKKDISFMGLSIDQKRMIETSDPSFYKWTQWIFAKMFQKGLVYRKKALTNWCESCKTVLANEQVLQDTEGVPICERCKQLVVEKYIAQWFLKITDYADRLIDDLEVVDWPDEIKRQQVSWIGRGVGACFSFQCGNNSLDVFTTRPDTLYGVSFLALAPEHPFLETLTKVIKNKEDIATYIEETKKKTTYARSDFTREKHGVCLEGVTTIHPATKKEIPIYVADYVLAGHGTGVVMGVPAHDERDFAFAKKYNLEIQQVIASDTALPYTGEGMVINSDQFDGLQGDEAKKQIIDTYGKNMTAYKLRDWTVSRQRYWGCPIPIVYDPDGVAHIIPEEHLPWLLPTDVDHIPTGEPPLARSKELAKRTEKLFGSGWTPEVDTLDTFVDSSWYFIRYLDPKNTEQYISESAREQWLPVDRYYGGAEHTTVHLLYARFFYKALFDMGLVNEEEPFKWRLNRGLVLAKNGKKMSKSLGNSVDPRDLCERYGSDVVRAYFAFLGPFDGPYNYPYSDRGIVGVRKFFERVFRLKKRVSESLESNKTLDVVIARTIKKVTESIERHKFNTAVSALMECTNECMKQDTLPRKQYETFLRLLAPIAPFLTDYLFKSLGNTTSIHFEMWPQNTTVEDVSQEVVVVIQQNGKKRGTVSVPRGSTEKYVLKKVREQISSLKNVSEKKIVFLKNKVLNLVS